MPPNHPRYIAATLTDRSYSPYGTADRYAHTEDGVSIAYWTFGQGEPFVLPPGGPASPSLGVWRTSEGSRFVERLAEHRQPVRLYAVVGVNR